MKELIRRWQAESPVFWTKTRNIMIVIGTAAVGIWTINAQMNLALAPLLITICKYTIAVCVAIGLSAQITTK